jgi:hypothetical protein
LTIRGNTLKLGTIRGNNRCLALPPDARSTHLYITGGSGVGKSKLLEHLVRQDIKAWRDSRCGVLLLDPHGSVYHNVVDWLADGGSAALKRPVVLIDPSRSDRILAYNVLRQRETAAKWVVIDALVEAIAHVWGAANTQQTPLFARWASNLLTLLYQNKLTLAEATTLLDDLPLRQTLAGQLDEESLARRDWAMAGQLNARDFENQVGSTVNRVRSFLENDHLKTMFGQTDISFDFRSAIEEGWIVLVNLSQEGGRLSQDNASLFGRLLLADLWTAAKERGKPRDASQIKPFYVYMDEFQNFITPTIAENLDQARGFGLHLTMAHQYPSQLSDRGDDGVRLLNSIMANATSKIVFRTQIPKDLPDLAQWLFMGTMNPEQVKLKLYSTKVMGYREEERQSTTNTYSSTHGKGISQGTGSGRGTNRPIEPPKNPDYDPGSESEQESDNASTNEFDTDGESTSTSKTPVLIPIVGQELSHVQFASLEEQLFEAMKSLFSQDERECVVRLAGMKAPVSLRTPQVQMAPHNSKKLQRYIEEAEKRWPFVIPAAEAKRRMAERRNDLLGQIKMNPAAEEPMTARARRGPGSRSKKS